MYSDTGASCVHDGHQEVKRLIQTTFSAPSTVQKRDPTRTWSRAKRNLTPYRQGLPAVTLPIKLTPLGRLTVDLFKFSSFVSDDFSTSFLVELSFFFDD